MDKDCPLHKPTRVKYDNFYIFFVYSILFVLFVVGGKLMSDDSYSYYQDEFEQKETAYKKINFSKLNINEIELILKNPIALHPDQLKYLSYMHKLLMDDYNGLYINTEKAEKELKNIYNNFPSSLRW